MEDVFDCSKLASRAFAIEKSLLDSKGYGEVYNMNSNDYNNIIIINRTKVVHYGI